MWTTWARLHDPLPGYAAFYLSLHGLGRPHGQRNYAELCRLWVCKGMTSLRGLLIHYNTCDVVPFMTALQRQCDNYKQAELPSEACNAHRAKFVDIMTHLPRALCLVPSAAMLQGPPGVWWEDTGPVKNTEWYGDGMVALSSKTYYCRDSQGQDKLSSKGLQKKANADSLTYEAYRRVLSTGRSDGGVNRGIRAGSGGQVYTYWQERTALSYVYLKSPVADDGIHTEPLHLWAAHSLPAYLPVIWPPPAPPMPANMRRMTCDCSGLFACSWPAVSEVHADHSTSDTVLSGHYQDTRSHPGLLQSYAAGLQGTGQASPLPCGAAGRG